jgi:serine/threonine protein kinase
MYEFVEGGTLADVIREWQPLGPAERLKRAVGILRVIAAAVGHCHAMTPPIVHRDLKPANILMHRGTPRITDFGIGGSVVEFLVADEKSRRPESLMGRLPSLLSGSYSLMYSSPQQRNGERPDPRDDVHALGVIAFQMLTGRLDAEVKGNWHKRLKTDGTPDALIDLIGNSTSDEPNDRPRDAREWDAALSALAKNVTYPIDETRFRSLRGDVAARMRFVNKSGQTIHVYWLDYQGKRVLYHTLRDGGSYEQRTYLTHPWLITDENGAAWEIYLPTEQPQALAIVAPKRK